MALNLTDTASRVPYDAVDTTRAWVEQYRKDGLLKPQLILRFATDTNYVRNMKASLYSGSVRKDANTNAMMNIALPGQRVPGILNWQVTENLDQITQAASFECLNALPISETETTLAVALPGYPHNNTIRSSHVANSLFVVEQVNGNVNVENYQDSRGYYFREANVKYRVFANETMTVTSMTGFPDPRIPNDDDNDVPDLATTWPNSSVGAGAYFILVGNEVIRVHDYNVAAKTFQIAPGGRAVNGVLDSHGVGERVRLLSFGPHTGDWCAMGFLNVDDYSPQTAILRPGTCITSYEGYGDITGPLTHTWSENANYTFTGYWFVSAVEPSFSEDGVPKVKVDLKGVGNMYEQQKITPDLVRRIKNQFGQWKVGQKLGQSAGQTIWGAANHDRQVKGDWVDFNSWDPSSPRSYPMKIKTEFAQHKEFAEHMADTKGGVDCLVCRAELAEYLKSHKIIGPSPFIVAGASGRHIYRESIRVADPIKTYIRLVSTIAAAAWDHPSHGSVLAQRFTKIPFKLFDNIRDLQKGYIYNGQIILRTPKSDPDFDWFTPTYDDTEVVSKRGTLACPFESSYDNASFAQPMLDLAEMNGNTFWISRDGHPVFKPRNFSMRQEGSGQRDEWFMTYGSSISGYNPNINPDAVITQCWVSGTTAFDSKFTVLTGGTGFKNGQHTMYSALGGNIDGLALTSGVQQVQTTSLDNQVFGLEWNTEGGWGVILQDSSTGQQLIATKPPFYDGEPALAQGSKRKDSVKRVQRTINYFLVRKYINPFKDAGGSNWVLKLTVDGTFGPTTKIAVKALQTFLGIASDGIYGRSTHNAALGWVNSHAEFVKLDIFWYVANDPKTAWEAYCSAVTGIPLQLMQKKGHSGTDDSDYIPDQAANNQEREEWTKGFAKAVVNYGNRIIDESLDKAAARSISTNIADPRILPGDVIWCEIPGYISSINVRGQRKAPYTNGIYVTSISRQMDLQGGVYTGTYSGYRFRGSHNQGEDSTSINQGWDYYGDGKDSI